MARKPIPRHWPFVGGIISHRSISSQIINNAHLSCINRLSCHEFCDVDGDLRRHDAHAHERRVVSSHCQRGYCCSLTRGQFNAIKWTCSLLEAISIAVGLIIPTSLFLPNHSKSFEDLSSGWSNRRVPTLKLIRMAWLKANGHRKAVPIMAIPFFNTWRPRKIAAISQTIIFSDAFSWMKMYEFRLIFHWTLFLRVQLITFIGPDKSLAPTRRQTIIWISDG